MRRAAAQRQVDAVTTDNVILSGFVDQNEGEFKLVGEPFTEEPYGIGLKKDDTDFRSFINDALEAAFEDGDWAEAWKTTAGTVLPLPEPPAVDRYTTTDRAGRTGGHRAVDGRGGTRWTPSSTTSTLFLEGFTDDAAR